jgi:DNA-binding LytR/AlgR family response regulator
MTKILKPASLDNYIVTSLFIRDKSELKQVSINEILFFQAENAYTRIITNDSNKHYVSSQNIGKIEKKLTFPVFCRVHRSYIVNLNHVNGIIDNGLKIDKFYIPIGRNYRHILDSFILL